ncbi:MAG: chloride channel protein [Candidatus Zixiibacteriota bacterium]
MRGTNALLLIASLVGITTGLGAIGFTALIRYFNRLFFGMTDRFLSQSLGAGGFHYWTAVIPAIGGLIVGPIVFLYAREARGHGVPEVMNAVARLGGVIRPRVALAKAVASAACIGSGGSAGREGPIVQIGSALGSTVGQFLGFSGERIKILVGCGAAAGISAVFNAPIAGVLFSLEVILGDFAIGTFSPVLVSSVLASVLTRSILGNHPAFAVPGYELASAWEVLFYAVMSVGLGLVAVLFTKTLDVMEDGFERLRIPNVLKPVLGGLLLGLLALMYPQLLADGYESVRLALHNYLALGILVPLVFLKIVATSLTLGSGSSGGIFAPSLFMGAMAGGAFGYLAHAVFPEVTANPGAYALVGMAGVIAAATHAPITALVIVFEMTGDYHIVLPLMITVAISTVVARSVSSESIYTMKLVKRGIDIRGGRDLNILQRFHVADVLDDHYTRFPSQAPLDNVLAVVEESHETHFVVEGSGGELRGLVSLHDMRGVLAKHDVGAALVAEDVARHKIPELVPADDLQKALEAFNLTGHALLPVVRDGTSKIVVGVVRREALLNFYNLRLLEQLRR